MSYRLRVYGPTTGVSELTVWTNGNEFVSAAPLGNKTPCIDEDAISVGIEVTATLNRGYIISRWAVNVDENLTYQYSDTCSVRYSGTARNVYVRIEVEEESAPPQTTYYATLIFDANGGIGGPDRIEGESVGMDMVDIDIPFDEPTRKGYTFAGWAYDNPNATRPDHQPGDLTSWKGSTTGRNHYLYAVWIKDDTTSVYIWDNGGWRKATPYVWDYGGWKKATSYIWDYGFWRKGI